MLNIPALKFEKSTNYLNTQLDIQLNNKQLVSDIIANINLILSKKPIIETTDYLGIQESANKFLENISDNITIIEELKREIKHITSDLTEVMDEINRKEKSKEYYIAAISAVKNNIENYTLNFQYFEQKLGKDNIDFDEFINKNDFKYNLVSNEDDGSYELSSISINDTIIENTSDNEPVLSDSSEIVSEINDKDAKINELTNEFRAMLSNLSEDTILSLDLITALKSEFSNTTIEPLEEEPINNEIEVSTIEEILPQPATEEELSINETENNNDNNVEIDYSSIYKNYYNKNISAIEENIFSEYSTFESSSNISTKNTTPAKPLFILDETEDLEENEDTTANETLESTNEINNECLEITNEINSENSENTNEINNENSENTNEINNENLEITDEDLLNQILEEELLKNDLNLTFEDNNLADKSLEQTPSENNTSILDSISDDDLLAELLISDNITDSIISEETTTSSVDETVLEKDDTHDKILDYCNLDEKIKNIKKAISDNDSLIISEKENKIFLPYTMNDLDTYLKTYPVNFLSSTDVVEQEFILPLDKMLEHPAQSRFLETYNLIKSNPKNSTIYAIIYGLKLCCKYNLNPAIIAACKNQTELEDYLKCLKTSKLSKFKHFKIIYQINPL